MPTDEELLAAWREGDLRAGEQLFRRYFSSIRKFFANKVDIGVEELVQRTFEGCTKSRDRFRGGDKGTFRAFLFAIARNVLFDYFREQQRDRLVEMEDQSVADMAAGPSSILVGEEQQRLLLEALRQLPLKAQIVLELYFWEKATGAELGELLGVPENTARSRLRAAKKRLKEALMLLESAPRVLKSTLDDIEGWAARVRDALDGGC